MKRDVEIYVGNMDHTWHTTTVTVDGESIDDIEETSAEKKAIDQVQSELEKGNVGVAFLGLYHMGDIEADPDGDEFECDDCGAIRDIDDSLKDGEEYLCEPCYDKRHQ